MVLAISAAIIEKRRILLVQKKSIWILPGGKPNENESDLECLIREVKEELSGTELQKNFQYYKQFQGVTPFSKQLLDVKVYFAHILDELGKPSGEISDVKLFYSYANSNISHTTSKIIESLKENNYID